MNLNTGNIRDLHLTVIYQNGGFTKVWLSLKTIFFPFIVAIMCWFWNRVHQLQRSPVLIEYMLLGLGAALTFLNRKSQWILIPSNYPYQIVLLLFSSSSGVFHARFRHAVHAIVGWHSSRCILRSAMFILVDFCRWAHAHSRRSIDTEDILEALERCRHRLRFAICLRCVRARCSAPESILLHLDD